MLKYKSFLVVSLLALTTMLTGCMGYIDTGTVGVRTQFGQTSEVEVKPEFTTWFLSTLDIYSTKQIGINLQDMKPKAGDNLSMRELDAIVYYKADENKIADFAIRAKGVSIRDDQTGLFLPGYLVVRDLAKSAIQKEVSQVDSLVVHKSTDKIEEATAARLQKSLDDEYPGVFKIERVTITKAITDDSVEDSIRKVVQAQKDNEAMTIKIDTSEKQAKLNQNLNSTYTQAYLQHEYNEALKTCAANAGCTMIVGNPSGQILNLK